MITSGVSFDATTHSLVRNYVRNHERVGVALEQLSTGKRINRPSDDPSGFIAAEEIRGELRELQSEDRAATFRRITFRRHEAALSNVQTQLHSVRANVVSQVDGLQSESQRDAVTQEIEASLDSIDRTLTYADLPPIEGLSQLQVDSGENLIAADPARAAELVDQEINNIASRRAGLGTAERTDEIFDYLREDKEVILTEALSQIEDTDFAAATAELAQGQVLTEASIVALAYATQQLTDQFAELIETLDVVVE